MSLTIRPARPEDTLAIHGLLAENGLTIDGVTYDAFSPLALVAVREGEIVGYIQVLLGKPYSVLTDLAVTRPRHHQGIGPRLLSHMETLLREYGASRWVASVNEKDDHVRALIERWGGRGAGLSAGYLKELS